MIELVIYFIIILLYKDWTARFIRDMLLKSRMEISGEQVRDLKREKD